MSDENNFDELMEGLLRPSEIKKYENNLSLKEMFNERLKELDLSQKQAEALLGIEYRSLNGILNKTAKRVDIINLLKLSEFLGILPEKILTHYAIKEMNPESVEELHRAKRHSFIVNNFDLSALKKSKFINGKINIDEAEKRIVKFFGLRSIFDYSHLFYSPAFSRTKRTSNSLMRDFWVKSAFQHFIKLKNPNKYDRDALVELMPKIKPYTTNEKNGIITVIKALYHIGITIIYQPHLPSVQVRGATYIIEGKPCIVLTNLYENYPTIWFALLHELHHVLYDFDDIEKRNYHLSGEPDLFLLQESKANEFAREYFLSYEKSNYIFPFIDERIIVEQYAQENEIHSSIIYLFYQHDQTKMGKTWDGRFNRYVPDISTSLKEINTNVWQSETIEESVKIIKETVFNF